MRSEEAPASAGQTWEQVGGRFGTILLTSVSVLFVEAVIGGIAVFVWGQTQESPDVPLDALNVFFLFLFVPIAALIGAVPAVVVSVAGVMPLLVIAGWAGRRTEGRERWYWVPVMAAAWTALPVLGGVTLLEAGVLPGLALWLVTTVGLAIPALVVRRLLLPDRTRLTGVAMLGRVVLYGTLAVVSVFALGGFGLWAGLAYEPPRLDAALIAGTWTDGKGGTLTLAADGRATATGVRTYGIEGKAHVCAGSGNWAYDPGDGPWGQTVGMTVEGCDDLDDWEVFGTPEHPKLFVRIGDPDSWDLYVLERRG